MNKTVILLFIVTFFSGIGISQTQPKFNLTKEGVKPVVLNFDAGVTANQIYTKIKEWIKLTYKNPVAALRIDKENTMVKVGEFREKAWKIRTNDFDYWYVLEYTLLIEIKDARIRVTFETPDEKYKVWYNSNGTIISKFKDSEASFEATINDLLTSLYNHIKGVNKKEADDW